MGIIGIQRQVAQPTPPRLTGDWQADHLAMSEYIQSQQLMLLQMWRTLSGTISDQSSSGMILDRPSAGVAGRSYISTDLSNRTPLSVDDGSQWQDVLTAQSVGSTEIEDLAVTNAKIASLAVTSAKIEDLAVTNAKIASLAVTSAKIDALAVTNAKIGDLSVDTIKIAGNAVTTPKVANNAITVHGNYSNNSGLVLTSSAQEAGTLTLSTDGGAGHVIGKVHVNIVGNGDPGTSTRVTLTLRKDSITGTLLDLVDVFLPSDMTASIPASLIGYDSSPAATQTYKLEAHAVGSSETSVWYRRLLPVNFKK